MVYGGGMAGYLTLLFLMTIAPWLSYFHTTLGGSARPPLRFHHGGRRISDQKLLLNKIMTGIPHFLRPRCLRSFCFDRGCKICPGRA